MYVSKLDRPWLETPFIFQGFEIRAQEEIDMLQRYCSVVYIDVDRGQLSDDQVRRLIQMQREPRRSTSQQPARRKVREPGRFIRLPERYEPSCPGSNGIVWRHHRASPCGP